MTSLKYITAVLALVGAVGSTQATVDVNKSQIQFMGDEGLSNIQGAKKAKVTTRIAKNYPAPPSIVAPPSTDTLIEESKKFNSADATNPNPDAGVSNAAKLHKYKVCQTFLGKTKCVTHVLVSP